MSQFGDYTPEQAYQENVAQPDERAWAREARQVVIEQLVGKESGQVLGYRCVHEGNGARIRQAIIVGLNSGQQVLVDVCYVCLHNLKAARR